MSEERIYGIPKLNIEDFVTSAHHELIPKWKKEGYTDKVIYEMLGISVSTGHKWKNRHPWFKKLFDKGRAELQERLEEALVQRALGKTYEEVDTTYDAFGEVSEKKVKTKYTQSESAIMTLLAQYEPSKSSKKSLEQTQDDSPEGAVVFGGEDEL